MDSKENKIWIVFAILVLSVYLRSTTATNIDCGGKPFHCVNSTHFMICVDLGAGVSKTVDDFSIQCPQTTVCRENNQFECEYQSPTTTQSIIYPVDQTNDFTTDTTLLNSVTNTISSIIESNTTRLFKEYFNTDVTTYADYITDKREMKTYKLNEIPEILSNINDKMSISNNLQATTETYVVKNLHYNSPKNKSRNSNDFLKLLKPSKDVKLFRYTISPFSTKLKQITSERLLVTNFPSNTTDNPYSRGKLSIIKIIDNFYDTTTETSTTDTSALTEPNAIIADFLNDTKPLRELSLQPTKKLEISEIGTEDFTQTTLYAALYPRIKNNTKSKNPSSKVKNIKTVLETNEDLESVKITHHGDLLTLKENLIEVNLLKETETPNFNSTASNIINKIEMTTEFNLGQIAQNKDIITLSPYKRNMSDITNKNDVTTVTSTLELPMDLITHTKQTIETTTVFGNILSHNEIISLEYENTHVISPEVVSTSKPLSAMILEYQVPKPVVNEINMTSTFDFKLTSENLTPAEDVNLANKHNKEIAKANIATSPDVTDTNMFLPNYKVFKEMSTKKTGNSDFDHTPSTVYGKMTPMLGQIIPDNKVNTSPSNKQYNNTTEVIENITMISANIPSVTFNNTSNLNNADLTTSYNFDTTVKSTSTDFNLLTPNYDFSKTENIVTMEGKTSVLPRDKDQNLTTILQTNLRDQSNNGEEIIVSTYSNINQYNQLPSQDKNIQQINPSAITHNPYIYDTSLRVENTILNPDLYLMEQKIHDKNVYTLASNNKIMKGVYGPRDVTTTYKNDILMTKYDFTTLTSLFSLKLTHKKEMSDKKEVIESTTVSYKNENERFLLQYEIGKEMTINSTLSKLTPLEYRIAQTEKIQLNETAFTLGYKNSSLKSGTQTITEELKYDTNIEKPKRISFIKDIRNNESQNYEEVVVDSRQYFPITVNNTISNINTNNESITNELELVTIASSNLFRHSDNLTTGYKETYTTTDVIYHENQIIGIPKIDAVTINKVTEQNKLYDTSSLTSQDQNIEKISATNDITILSTSKPPISTLVSNIDEILYPPIIAKTNINLLRTGNWSNRVTNTDKNGTENIFFQIEHKKKQNNTDQDILTHEVVSTTNMVDAVFSIETEQYSSSNKYSIVSENIKPNEEINISTQKFQTSVTDNLLVEQTLNLTETPLSDIRNNISTYIKKNATPTSITNYYINNQPSSSSKFPFPYYHKNNSLIRDYKTNNNGTVIRSKLDRNIILLHTDNNNTTNNYDIKNNKLNTTNDNHILNERSMLINDEIPFYKESFKTVTSNSVHIDRNITDGSVQNSLIEEAFKTTTPIIAKTDEIQFSQIVIKNAHELYTEENILTKQKQNLTATIHDTDQTKYFIEINPNSSVSEQYANKVNHKVPVKNVTANNIPQSEVTEAPIRNLGSVTTETLILLESAKQSSLCATLNQTLQKSEVDIISGKGSDYNRKTDNITKKDDYTQTVSQVTSITNKSTLATTNLVKTDSRNSTNVGRKSNQNNASIVVFNCNNRLRGRYADKNVCKRYYICIGRNQPVVGECPNNTVFSEIKKQCTKNLSHCIRNNQFHCIQAGRFSDVLRSNIYYICVSYNNAYLRFKFQCQNGFHLNKTSVICVNDIKLRSQMTSMSIDSESNKASDQSKMEHKSKQKKRKHTKLICQHEGKFPDAEDCRKYYVCSKKSKSGFRRRTKKCDSDEVFHQEKKKCVERDSYECS